MRRSLRFALAALAVVALVGGAVSAWACSENKAVDHAPWDAAVERRSDGNVLRRFVPPELYSGRRGPAIATWCCGQCTRGASRPRPRTIRPSRSKDR